MPDALIYVAIVLDETEAVAVKAACAAVVTSAPGLFTPDHPLFTGMLAVEKAYREATADA